MLENKQPNLPSAENDDLSAWVMEKVDAWVEYREQQYDSKWKEYYRLWRGIWNAQDKNRESERSRLVSPALSQAIEVTVSEIEEAVFSKRRWIDIDPKITRQPTQQQIDIVEQLLEEYELNGVPEACSETFL
ncbi:MAG: hypothetical protein GTO54_01205, partial [Nitrososphaeria archaeon]|nr:hypothetical protein [Nitrososphaeria archaeon]